MEPRVEVLWCGEGDQYHPYEHQAKTEKRPIKFIGYHPDLGQDGHLIILVGLINEGGKNREHKDLLKAALENLPAEKACYVPSGSLVLAGVAEEGKITSWESTGFNFSTPEDVRSLANEALFGE